MTRNDGGGVGIAGDFLVSSYKLVVASLPLLAISLIISFPFLSFPCPRTTCSRPLGLLLLLLPRLGRSRREWGETGSSDDRMSSLGRMQLGLRRL